MAIDYAAITEVARAWVRDAVSLPDGQVIIQDQNGMQLQPPYATVRVGSTVTPFPADFSGWEYDSAQAQGQEVELFVTGPRVVSVAVNVYTKGAFGGAGALAMLSNARDRLQLPSVLAAFAAAGAAIAEVSDVRNLSLLLETNFQGRAHMELTLNVAAFESERTGYIATVSGTGTFTESANDTTPTVIPYSATIAP